MSVRRRLVQGVLAGWVVATVISQHPQREFDRLRHIPVLRLVLPDWRFFVPRAADRDLVPVARLSSAGGQWETWERLFPPARRSWFNAMWFPRGRESHAVIDLARELQLSPPGDIAQLEDSAAFRVLRARLADGSGPSRGEAQLAVVAEIPFGSRPEATVSWVSPPFPLA